MNLGEDYSIRLLSPSDAINQFKTGDVAFQPLKPFLRNQALDFQQAGVVKTYVAATHENPAKILGFITLTASEVDIRQGYELQDCPYANRYDSLPAVKIARLATDSRYRGQGVGALLVSVALALAKDEIAERIGCRFLITDAKQAAICFYQSQGFTLLDTEENRLSPTPIMFLDLLTVD